MEFCDLKCKHADFPLEDSVDGSGSCQTFIAIYCHLKEQYVLKNIPCKEKEER